MVTPIEPAEASYIKSSKYIRSKEKNLDKKETIATKVNFIINYFIHRKN